MAATATIPVLNYIGGEWAPSRSGETVPDRNPAHTDEILGEVTVSTADDVRRAVDAAAAACITPWNFPIAIPAWKIAPALVAGNTVVLKPASLTPLCAAEVVRCFVAAGLPNGALNLVLGTGEALSRAITSDERIKAISF